MSDATFNPPESISGSVTQEEPDQVGVHAIIEEAEQLVHVIGNTAVFEFHRLIQLFADLKNHPDIKKGE
jgi:hypothetical protein